MGASVEHVAQEGEGRPVRPVQVVEQEDRGRLLAGELEHAGDGREEQPALRLGIRRHRRRRPGDAPRERGDEPGQLAAVARDVRAEHLLRRVLDERAERLDPRPVGHGHPLGRVPGEDDRALRVQLAGGVDGEAGLADPGLAGDEDRLSRPPAGRLPAPLDPLALRGASDVGRRRARAQPGRERKAAAGTAGRLPARPRRSAPAGAGRAARRRPGPGTDGRRGRPRRGRGRWPGSGRRRRARTGARPRPRAARSSPRPRG